MDLPKRLTFGGSFGEGKGELKGEGKEGSRSGTRQKRMRETGGEKDDGK